MRSFRIPGAALAALFVLAIAQGALAAPKEISSMELFKLLNESRGKIVVVNFFATWCPPCILEIPGLIEVRKQYPESELMLISVSFDTDMDKLEQFMGKAKLNYPVYMGTQDTAEAFQVIGLPKLLVYNKKGALETNHNGFMSPDALKETIDTLRAQP